MRKLWGLLTIVLLIALAVGCAAPAPTATPSPSPAPKPAPTATPTPTPSASPTVAPKPTSTPTATPKPVLPTRMMWTTLDVGTDGYNAAVALGQAVQKMTGMTVRVLPVATGVSRMLALKIATADIAFVAYEAYCASVGIEEYSGVEWGPQQIRVLVAPLYAMTPGVRGNSGIKTMADLKAKGKALRVPYVAGQSSINIKAEAMLAFINMTWNDVTRVNLSSSAAAQRGPQEGVTDFTANGASYSTTMFELEASPHGIYWVPLPRSDTEGWKRIQALIPLWPAYLPIGAGVKEANKIEGFGFTYPQLITYEGRISDDAAYQLAKTIDEGYEANIKGAWQGSEIYKFKDTIRPPLEAPYHAGVIKYAREKGIWTAEHDAANKLLLDREAKLKVAWDTVINEAAQQKIKQVDFPKYWLQRKAELVK